MKLDVLMASPNDDSVRVLVIAGNARNATLLKDFLDEEGFETDTATELETAHEILDENPQPEIALVDIDRFDTPVWSYCDRLYEASIPFLVLSKLRNRGLRRESRTHGAESFLQKPLPKQELRAVIRTASKRVTDN